MPREIAYDVTHIVSRLDRLATSGMDRVDLAYGRYLSRHGRMSCGVHYGYLNPHRLSPQRAEALIARFEAQLGETEDGSSTAWSALRAWIMGETPECRLGPGASRGSWTGWLRRSAARIATDSPRAIPENALYLNVAQHAFEHARFFRWLDRRPDVLPVFLVHDLLPLDLPEFFRDGYMLRFEKRVETIMRHARAIITTSEVVRERVAQEYAKRGRPMVPLHVEPLASPLGPTAAGDRDAGLDPHPYFVVISTIEPRKNHLMLLHVWRRLAAERKVPPRLVVVGASGWDYDATLAVLERSSTLKTCVARVSGLPRADLRTLIANARALLMPSFAEGYGIPIVEALTLGTPVVASDIPIFREVTQGQATFLSPIDGEAWLAEVARRTESRDAPPRPVSFAAPTEAGYFAGIEDFLARL